MKNINIKNFGIIKSANIKLDGLTILTGQNDTGKSSAGKLLFSIIKALNKLDDYTEEQKEIRILEEIEKLYLSVRDKLTDIPINLFAPKNFAESLKMYYENPEFTTTKKDDFELIFSERKRLLQKQNLLDELTNDILEKIKDLVEAENQDEEIITEFLKNYLQSEFYFQISSKNKNLETLIEYNEGEYDILSVKIKSDKINSLNYSGQSFFTDATLIETPLLLQIFDLIENADVLGDKNMLNYGRPKTHFHIKDLINKVKNAKYSNKSTNEKLSNIINKVISGEFHFDKENDRFYYKKNNNENIEAINTAAGIKSFGLIQLLLKANSINTNSLVIIDEPENHLHPRWQIEYAKLIIELVKNKITVLISSHSPYMIQALKTYSEENEIEKKTNFYLSNIEQESQLSVIENANDKLKEIFLNLAQPLTELVWL